MLPTAIQTVVRTFRQHQVRALLMGGQACVVYGAAEFSKDVDFATLVEQANLDRLHAALDELQAEVIAVPPFRPDFLQAGLAVHFRCRAPEVAGLRIDVMGRLRGLPEFEVLWARRTVVGRELELLSLHDLIAAKKTQRDKDWPMLRRLVEVDYFAHREQPGAERVRFWLHELRTPALLRELARQHPQEAHAAAIDRPLLQRALNPAAELADMERALHDEELRERAADRAYWEPLRRLLEELRRQHRG